MRLSVFLLSLLAPLTSSLAPTDSIQDADPSQSSYLDNHNLHPATVGSSIFGILWKNQYGAKERWYAKPLVYTPPGSKQIVFIASTLNIIRTLDAVDGTLVKERTLQPPFLQSDIGCTDIPDFIGVIGTPIIDPATNTAFFFSKGYQNGAASGGILKGIYKFYAVDVSTLEDKPGFPIIIDGRFADNDNSRYFIGGTILQRPALNMVNGHIVGAFGGHCDLFNYTGMLITVSPKPGVGVTSLYAMEASPGGPPVSEDIIKGNGGEAGIWQGGMSAAVDGNRLFITTGNGKGHENGDIPASGRTPLSTLDEVVASFSVSSIGKLSLTDYFEPYEYISMDNADRDLGSSGVTLLDPAIFKGTGISRMAVTIGKNGKAYILNANNLGGFKQGPGGTDNIIQTIIADGSVFAGCGSYPLEGGYIYFNPVGFSTVCYKIGQDSQGVPQFTKAGVSATKGAGRVGIGTPVITTYKGQAGTGILWITDPDLGVRAFNAVPKDGVLIPINLTPTGGINKFQRPAFGDGRLYVTNSNGAIICLGSPVALPLQCTQPVDFGDLAIGSTLTKTVNCTTLIAITSINGCTTGDATFQCANSTLPKGPLAKGAVFSFPVTWNLTQASIDDAKNASFAKVLPGAVSTSLDLHTTNGIAKYSNLLPISLTGSTVSKTAFLVISPPEVDLGGIVVGSDGATSGLSSAVLLSNVGSQPLIFLGSAWTKNIEADGDEEAVFTNITNGILGDGFKSTSLPKVGDVISPGGSLTVPLLFFADKVGQFSTSVVWWTTGGKGDAFLTAGASTRPIANISVSRADGTWDFSEPLKMNFGNMLAGTTQSRNIRICNSGGSSLTITKSKPPISTELLAPNAGEELHEAQTIDIDHCALGLVTVASSPLGVNLPNHALSDSWILNVDDQTFGVHDVLITTNIYTRQVGPLLPNGTAEYGYLGCYYDGAGRQLPKKMTNPQDTNENGICQQTCFASGFAFAGTQYRTECWCGNLPPSALKYTADTLKRCGSSCAGDITQACGGLGTYESIYYDRLKYTPGSDSIPPSSSPSSSSTVVFPISSSITVPVSSLLSSSPTTLSSSTLVVSSQSSSKLLSVVSSFVSSVSPSSSIGPSSSISSLSSPVSVSSSASTSPSASASPPSQSPSSSFSTTTKPPVSSLSSETASSSTSLPTILSFSPLGCFSDPNTGPIGSHNMRLLFSNNSMTPSLCISSALARLSATPATTFNYIGLEYGKECYAGTAAPSPQPTSLTGPKACTLSCVGDKASGCGGGRQVSVWTRSGVEVVATASITSASGWTWIAPLATATP